MKTKEVASVNAVLDKHLKAVNELDPGDVEKFIVVRVGDEILVDLMRSGCRSHLATWICV